MKPSSILKRLAIVLTLAIAPLSISTAQAAVKVGSYIGTWKASITYAGGDLITYSNKTFISLVAKNKAKDPLKNPKVWQLLAGVGATGVDGAIGSQGGIGSKGDTGLQGPIGLTGPSGTNGVDGVVGPKGDAGIPTVGTDVGDMQYWDGNQWQVVPIIQPDPSIKPTLALCSGVPTWILYFCPGTSPYSIGETGPAGGKVFYITDSGLHGLEAAPADQADSQWGCYGTSISGAQSILVGTGAANTAAIIAGCSEANTAAKVADAYVFNGFTDWYLPSKDELNLLYGQKDVVGSFANINYLSSTENFSFNAWIQDFSGGFRTYYFKNYPYRVRAIRDF
jgi:hypothetical protein